MNTKDICTEKVFFLYTVKEKTKKSRTETGGFERDVTHGKWKPHAIGMIHDDRAAMYTYAHHWHTRFQAYRFTHNTARLHI